MCSEKEWHRRSTGQGGGWTAGTCVKQVKISMKQTPPLGKGLAEHHVKQSTPNSCFINMGHISEYQFSATQSRSTVVI